MTSQRTAAEMKRMFIVVRPSSPPLPDGPEIEIAFKVVVLSGPPTLGWRSLRPDADSQCREDG